MPKTWLCHKINNVDLFTLAANDKFNLHIKTQSKQALEIIKRKINWKKLIKTIEQIIAKQKEKNIPPVEEHLIYWS